MLNTNLVESKTITVRFILNQDIQLNVKDCKNLNDSFAAYCAKEKLDGENKYFAQGFGLQDATKGVVFTEFPPVLHLQMKRFEYDMERDMLVKVLWLLTLD
jgi:ubiquitin carboxyl-terminal hydrolase 7